MSPLHRRLAALENLDERDGGKLPDAVPDDWADEQIAALAQRTGRAVFRASAPALLDLFV